MAQPYESDLTRMIRELLQEKPHIVQEQKKGRALWWDKKLDPEERQRRDPEGSDWGVIAAYAWVRRGDYPKATSALSRVIQRNPEDIGAWNLLGESQRQAGQPGQAVRTLERASAIGRTSFATFFLLGEAYRDVNRLDRAATAYREAARLEPEFARAWLELGAAHIRLGERDEARGILERLERLDPLLAEELKRRLEGRRSP